MDKEKEKRAINYLKAFEPQDEPYYLCYSGGKDSDCIRILAELSGVKYELYHNLTTVDAPETVRYVKSIPHMIISRPKLSMWQLIVKNKMPPTRLMRYCCTHLKESGGKGRLKILGVRWAESNNRRVNNDVVKVLGKPKTMQKEAKKRGLDYEVTKQGGMVLNDDNDENRRFVEHCYRTTNIMVNPIVDWTDEDVWDFLDYYGCEGNPLYQCGYKRIGCIGCPMNRRTQLLELIRYSIYRQNYIRAFDRMISARKEAGLSCDTWTDGEAVFRWWLDLNDNSLSIEENMKKKVERYGITV